MGDTIGKVVPSEVLRLLDLERERDRGVPLRPRRLGNVATEAVVGALRRGGDEVGVDLAALAEARNVIAAALGRPLPA